MKANKIARCDLLESLGFEILHSDSRVVHADVEFDFSAVNIHDAKSLIHHAITVAYSAGHKQGKESVKQEVSKFLNYLKPEKEEDG